MEVPTYPTKQDLNNFHRVTTVTPNNDVTAVGKYGNWFKWKSHLCILYISTSTKEYNWTRAWEHAFLPLINSNTNWVFLSVGLLTGRQHDTDSTQLSSISSATIAPDFVIVGYYGHLRLSRREFQDVSVTQWVNLIVSSTVSHPNSSFSLLGQSSTLTIISMILKLQLSTECVCTILGTVT